MQWIILIGDKELTLDKIRNMRHYDNVSRYDWEKSTYKESTLFP